MQVSNQYTLDRNPAVPAEFLHKDESLVSKIKRKFQEIIPEKIRAGYAIYGKGALRVYTFCKKGAAFLHEVIPQAENIFHGFVSTSNFISDVFKKYIDFSRKLNEIKVFTYINIPFVLYQVAIKIHELAISIIQKVPSRVADAVLSIGSTAADITRIVAVLAGNALAVTAAGFLSIFSIAFHSKQLYHSVRFHRRVKEKFEAGENPISDLSDEKLKRGLDVSDLGKFKDRMNVIWENHVDDAPVMEHVHRAFRHKTIQKNVSNVLRIIAGVISIVASAILLAAPPLAPVVFGLIAVASLIYLADFITEKAVNYHFNRVIKQHAENIS